MKNYFDLTGQVALVTGCSTGLGVQMAKALANQGAKIVAIARRKEKIEAVATKIYGASEVKYDASALKNIAEIEALDPKYSTFPICVAKTQYSLSDDATKLGRPTGFTLTVREVKLSAGAEFIVVLTGAIMTMPGLPKAPAAFNIDVDDDGNITGLF